ncbi:hypothetical protein [Halolamina pelagica]|uniref:Uncharacterized protein n=1 Tax=Halolamina pelagica TaxID=699431 RepID=A0A1I5VR17_9EURY|nr:hypothetical protein [Halolamina pelagica]NHX37819.1 hypothetical protein [Halolamina sp. R1-12]SFQ09863.1 hypothetical protein SAMN05216277_11934 [Halolamina pelagica]
MRELLLQGDVSVPTTTSGQTALAAIITVVLLVGAIVAYRRSKVLGLSDEEKQVREDVRAQRRQRTAAELKLSVDTVQELSEAELQRRFMALFDTTAEETITRLPAAAKRVSSAVSSAWDQRVGWLPTLARRAVGLAGAVVVLGAVAVSGDAVVRLLQTDPSTPGPASITSSISTGIQWSIGIVGSYPYAGTLWELAYATAIIGVQWLYRQWALIATVLVVSAVSIVLLDRRLDDEVVPERMIQSRRLALGTALVGVVGVWLAGVAPVAVASVVGAPALFGVAVLPLVIALACTAVAWVLQQGRAYRITQLAGLGFALSSAAGSEWASIAGLWCSALVGILFIAAVGPHAVRRVRRGIAEVAGSDARPAAALLVIQRLVIGVSIVAGVLVVAYAVVSVANGQWSRVLAAAATAAPEVQFALGAVTMAVLGLTAYSLREAWPAVCEEVRAAYAQQAVRAKVLGRGIPWLGVFFSYVFFTMLVGSIPIALVLAVVVGVILRYGLYLADEAEYRADGEAIIRRLFRSQPTMIVARGLTLHVDGEEVYRLEVNGEEFVHDDQEQLVADVIQYVDAAIAREDEPRVDSREFADYLFQYGIADRADWEHKLDEVIRKTALKPFRSGRVPIIGRDKRRVSRSRFDALLDDFDDDRVRKRLRDDDLYRCLDLGDQWVTLERDPYTVDEQRGSWPTLSG